VAPITRRPSKHAVTRLIRPATLCGPISDRENGIISNRDQQMTGIAANICVLFTANDAYMRDLHLAVPSDCVASNTEEENHYALDQMRKVLKADTRPSTQLVFRSLARRDE
jgi:isochorismate hydrolase